jgi:predicted transcriptional regulator YdeE
MTMTYSVMNLDSFSVIGISLRTSNLDEQSSEQIGQLWARFKSENLAAKIPNQLNSDIYCIYSDYEPDQSYAVTLSCRVSTLEFVPRGMVSKIIPATTYRVYTSVGKIPDAVIATWEHIWQDRNIPRSFVADFEVYGAKTLHSNDVELDTFVAVHEREA